MARPTGRLTRFLTLTQALRRGREAAERERWSLERLDAYRRERLAELVAHATAQSAFYRELYGGTIEPSDVVPSALPSISKREWMDAFDDVVTDPRLKLAEVEGHLEQVRDDVLYLDEYRVMASSGSTGRRGVYVWSRGDWLGALGILLRDADRRGQGPRLPRLRLAVVGAPDARHMSYRFGASIDCGIFRVLRLGATTPLDEIVRALQRFRPDSIVGFPSLAAMLAAEQLAGRLHIAPRSVDTSGELLTVEMRRLVREAWGVEPVDTYALTEVGSAGFTCEAGMLHLCEDSCILEPVDAEGRPVPAGEPAERLLVTSLLNRTQPVIRLEVSDQLTLAASPCECGRTMAPVAELLGRADDVLELPTALGAVARLHPIHLRSPLGATREVVSYQIVRRPDVIDVEVVLAARDESVTKGVSERLRAVLHEHGVTELPLRVRAVESIAREPGMGKLKLVKTEA